MPNTESNIYYLPPEYARQTTIMLTWPHERHPWVDFEEIEPIFTALVYQITLRKNVLVTYLNDHHKTHILNLLKKIDINLDRLLLYQGHSNDIWVRDYGPLTVYKNGSLHLLNFQFNGWGYKYTYENDNALVEHLHKQSAFGDAPLEAIDLVLEGGSIDVDGNGSLLTTRRCLLEKNRNSTLTENQIADKLKKYLGVTRILWLDHGYLEGDDTDSHIDILARFTDPRTIAYMQCTDRHDSHFAELRAMEKQLKHLRDCQGNPYRLVPLPWPRPQYAKVDGRRLPASYANFLIINNAVLAPIYSDPADNLALQRLSHCFPNRTIVPINSLPIVEGGGSLHCISMQLPQVNYPREIKLTD